MLLVKFVLEVWYKICLLILIGMKMLIHVVITLIFIIIICYYLLFLNNGLSILDTFGIFKLCSNLAVAIRMCLTQHIFQLPFLKQLCFLIRLFPVLTVKLMHLIPLCSIKSPERIQIILFVLLIRNFLMIIQWDLGHIYFLFLSQVLILFL